MTPLPCDRNPRRDGYLSIDALVGLAIAVLTVTAAVGLASNAVMRLAQARDRLTAVRIADELYEGIYAGERPDGQQTGATEGRSWTYESTNAATETEPSAARRVRITIDRRFGGDLVVEAFVPPAPALASSN